MLLHYMNLRFAYLLTFTLFTQDGLEAQRLGCWFYPHKCTKHQFIHLLMATFKDLHIENSKNYKR